MRGGIKISYPLYKCCFPFSVDTGILCFRDPYNKKAQFNPYVGIGINFGGWYSSDYIRY